MHLLTAVDLSTHLLTTVDPSMHLLTTVDPSMHLLTTADPSMHLLGALQLEKKPACISQPGGVYFWVYFRAGCISGVFYTVYFCWCIFHAVFLFFFCAVSVVAQRTRCGASGLGQPRRGGLPPCASPFFRWVLPSS
jgi:hypothetical protein